MIEVSTWINVEGESCYVEGEIYENGKVKELLFYIDDEVVYTQKKGESTENDFMRAYYFSEE